MTVVSGSAMCGGEEGSCVVTGRREMLQGDGALLDHAGIHANILSLMVSFGVIWGSVPIGPKWVKVTWDLPE